MTCVLWALGTVFDPPAFLAESSFKPGSTYRKGDLLFPSRPDTQVAPSSGFTVAVSSAGFDDLDGQIRDAIAFLDEHEDELRRLGSFMGVEMVCLNFGVRRTDGAVQTVRFPAELLWRAGALDIELAITHYRIAEPS